MSKETKSIPATSLEKEQAHEIWDSMWKLSTLSEAQKQSVRSKAYQLFAAVILDLDEDFSTDGIIYPRAGNHHIAKLPLKYYQLLRNFVKIVFYKINKGNTSKIASYVTRWHEPLNNKIKNLSSNDEKNRAVRDYLKHDERLLWLRSEIIPISIIAEEPSKIDLESKKVATKLPKSKSSADIFLDSLMAGIFGDEVQEKKLLEEITENDFSEEYPPKRTEAENEDLNLRYSYIYNFNLKTNANRAYKYQERMAEKKVSNAMYDLAHRYEFGIKVKINKFKAKALIQEAASLGHDLSAIILKCHYDKSDVEEDWIVFCKMYFDQEDHIKKLASIQLYDLGSAYMNGAGVNKNYDKAIKYFTISKNFGNPKAYLGLGQCHIFDQGVNNNLELALEYFELAISHGVSEALLAKKSTASKLVANYNGLNGRLANYKKAAHYLLMLTDAQDNPVFKIMLGIYYINGQGVEKDFCEASKLFELAVKQGSKEAEKHLLFIEESAKIEETIKRLHIFIDKNMSNSSFRKIENLYEECSNYLTARQKTNIEFNAKIIQKYKEIGNFIKLKRSNSLSNPLASALIPNSTNVTKSKN